jgi:hypothetical protein
MARAVQVYTSPAGINEVNDDALRRIAERARGEGERVTTYTFDIEGEAEYGEAVFLEYAGRLAISWNGAVIWIEAPTAQSGVMTWFTQADWPR